MIELLFLLLPVAAFYGWYMGYHAALRNNENRNSGKIRNLTRGLNFFFNHDRKKAADELISFYDSQSNHSFEENLALGNLYRERGEMERAINFHNNIMTMEGLSSDERACALLELARDFIQSGLLDKAEEILKELISYDAEKSRACELLVKLYDQEKEWHKALDTIKSFRNIFRSAANISIKEAEYFCELGNDAFSVKQEKEALEYFKKAVQVNGTCVRAYLNIAEINIENRRFREALEALEAFSEAAPQMISLCVKLLARCFPEDSGAQELEILEKWLQRSGSEAVALRIATIICNTRGVSDAEEFIIRYLKKYSSIRVFSLLMDLRLESLDSQSQQKLLVFKSLIDAQKINSSRFVCRHCGFKSQMLFWKCPSCHKWETMQPNASVDFSQESLPPA